MLSLTCRETSFVYRMFIAPSYVSYNLAVEIARRAEQRLFEVAVENSVNAFVKRVVRRNGEYNAIVVVESQDRILVEKVIKEVEARTVKMGLKIINLLKYELKQF